MNRLTKTPLREFMEAVPVETTLSCWQTHSNELRIMMAAFEQFHNVDLDIRICTSVVEGMGMNGNWLWEPERRAESNVLVEERNRKICRDYHEARILLRGLPKACHQRYVLQENGFSWFHAQKYHFFRLGEQWICLAQWQIVMRIWARGKPFEYSPHRRLPYLCRHPLWGIELYC